MLDVYEIVKEKEVAIAQLRQEVEALRMVCQMLQDEGESVADITDSGIEPEETEPDKTTEISPVDDREAILASIRIRLIDARSKNSADESKSAVGQFRKAALDASRALFKRIPHSHFCEKIGQGNTIRSLFGRFGRHAA